MNQKIRLGPIAIFLTVIAAVLATLAMLTVATSRADAALAERFAKVTSIRYGLERDGNRFLREIDESLQPGGAVQLPEGAGQEADGTIRYRVEKDGYELNVVVAPDAAGSCEVRDWRITKIWSGADPFADLWQGL